MSSAPRLDSQDDVVEQDRRRRKFHTLDGMRGVAAFAVLLLHMPATSNLPLQGRYLAVDLFFLLSGFVLAHSYESKLNRGMSWSSFMLKRVIRLYPLYILGTLIAIAIKLWALPYKPPLFAIPLAILFIPTLVRSNRPDGLSPLYPFNAPAWSLAYELLVNFAFALSVKYLKPKTLGVVIALAAVGLIAEGVKRNGLDLGSDYVSKAGGSIRVAFSFFAGVGVFRLWRAGWRLPRVHPAILAVAPFVLFAIPGPRWLVDLSLVLLVFPLLVLAGASSEPRTNNLARALVVSGELSYPIYVLQFAFMSIFRVLFPLGFSQARGPSAPWLATICLALIVGGGWILYRWYDKPVRRWLDKVVSNSGLGAKIAGAQDVTGRAISPGL